MLFTTCATGLWLWIICSAPWKESRGFHQMDCSCFSQVTCVPSMCSNYSICRCSDVHVKYLFVHWMCTFPTAWSNLLSKRMAVEEQTNKKFAAIEAVQEAMKEAGISVHFVCLFLLWFQCKRPIAVISNVFVYVYITIYIYPNSFWRFGLVSFWRYNILMEVLGGRRIQKVKTLLMGRSWDMTC